MEGQFTRRQVATALASVTALAAQVPSPPPPQSPADELQLARDVLHRYLDQLAKFPLPMAVEPVVHFKA